MEGIKTLLDIMQRLRDPRDGCPWDREQNFHTIAPYTVEEAYEVADAIERNDMEDLREELGDLLFQVVFHAQMAQEKGFFDFNSVLGGINEKMIRRHPHVFANVSIESAAEQTVAWENHKEQERKSKGKHHSALDGVAKSLPAITRAAKLQRRAAKLGFDWDSVNPIFDKLEEETLELKQELTQETIRETVQDSRSVKHYERIEDEVGDILFTVVNIARHLEVDPELAIRRANNKFERRFRKLEKDIHKAGEKISELSIEQLEDYWTKAKREEKL